MKDQNKTPYLDALREYTSVDEVPFDVPGHHMGGIVTEASRLFGQDLFKLDLNAPIGLDNLANPHGVILEAEQLMADACHADNAFFLINGTSSGIIAMLMCALKANDKVILPRNVHKSIINGLILSGAAPEFVMPEIDNELEIANQPSLDDWKRTILKYPSAKAVFVINPTYFGAVTDLKQLVDFAHEHGMAVICDEAHGSHFYYHCGDAPCTAMDAGADMASVSFHKSGGSLTQSSVLLSKGDRYSRYEIQKCLNILNTTSPSGILMGSLDGARKFMVTDGQTSMKRAYELADYAAREINKIPGFHVCGSEHFKKHGAYGYDRTKIVISLKGMDINGFDLYFMIKKDHNIQLELAETNAVLGIMAIGNRQEHVEKLIEALKTISKAHYVGDKPTSSHHIDLSFPFSLIRPRSAFHAPGLKKPLEEIVGDISKEMVMIYPPGIPLICPGEVWSEDLVKRVAHYQTTGCTILKTYPDAFEVVDKANWVKFKKAEKRLNDYFERKITTPIGDGYSMPFEGDDHKATVVLIPYRKDTWRDNGNPARKEFKEVIMAIAEHEEVIVGIHPNIYKKVHQEFEGLKNVRILKVRYNDSWARDNMTIFVTKGDHLRGVDFRFNAWGGEVDGLYKNYGDDDKLSSKFDKAFKLQEYRLRDFILEGGSIHVDGDGTVMATEACLLSKGRNPSLTKSEIEETVMTYLGCEKMIWVPHGIYLDETNEHIDNIACFVKPGEVLMAWTEDKTDPQYEFCQATYKALNAATDAKGRKLKIHKIGLPNPALYSTKEEAKGIREGKYDAISRSAGNRLAASYVNFYMGKDFVVMPAFGVKEDQDAFKVISGLFPDKKVHQVYSREILLGGGNIHCITMQVPGKGNL